MKILIIDDCSYSPASKDKPKSGRYYTLEDAIEGTAAQNKTAHSLIQAYFNSGCFSDNASTSKELKNCLKRRIGEGFEAFVYFDPDNPEKGLQNAKKFKDIPEIISHRSDKNSFIRGRLKSWVDYTLKQRKKFIDNLICEMDTVGVNTPEYKKIINGLAKDD